MREGPRDGFVPRVLAYHASRDFVPLYAVYPLLFSDRGVGPGQISVLFIIWSVTGFVCEVPSGAWADSFDRRRLLVVSAGIYALGFATWTFWHDTKLSVVVALAVMANFFVAALGGILAPIVLDRYGRDPAVSSSVVVTFMTDFFGFLALLGIAALILL